MMVGFDPEEIVADNTLGKNYLWFF
jgi:hypothetical protein